MWEYFTTCNLRLWIAGRSMTAHISMLKGNLFWPAVYNAILFSDVEEFVELAEQLIRSSRYTLPLVSDLTIQINEAGNNFLEFFLFRPKQVACLKLRSLLCLGLYTAGSNARSVVTSAWRFVFETWISTRSLSSRRFLLFLLREGGLSAKFLTLDYLPR